MKYTRVLTSLLFVAMTSGCNQAQTNEPVIDPEIGTGADQYFTLVWEDLFNDTKLNVSQNWNYEVNGNGGGNNELQFYRAENVTVGKEPTTQKSCLIITAKKESYQGKTVTSGRINSRSKQFFTHGKIEASIKLPKTGNGLWPAFWMMGNDYSTVGWPSCGEIDILEMGHANGIKNNTTDRYFNGALHWGTYVNGNYPNYAQSKTSDYSLQDTFHLYTLIWDETSIKMYLDLDKFPNATPYFQMNISDAANVSSPGKYFHKPFFILFNLAVGGNFPQIWDINQVTALNSGQASMYVDFVKVYKKN